jgi:translation elongation factor EF-Tu-like GTPase
MFGVDSEQSDEVFLLTVEEVFHLDVRAGTTVVGPIESGVITTGDQVEVWREGKVIASATACLDFNCSGGERWSLLLIRITGSKVKTGDEIRVPNERTPIL